MTMIKQEVTEINGEIPISAIWGELLEEDDLRVEMLGSGC